ncbi:MAG: flagellar basal body L-ring protein, partial [Pseudorhodoplanes sp.]
MKRRHPIPATCRLRCAAIAALGLLLSNCAALDRIATIGQPPPLSTIENPTSQPGYKPVQMPMPM